MIQTEFTTRTSTLWILVVTLLGLIWWDWLAYKSPKKGDTISELILSESRRYTGIPFFFGVVMGHFFWPQQLANNSVDINVQI